MIKRSNHTVSVAAPQRSRPPLRVHPNSSSRADGLWLGAPRGSTVTDQMSLIGRIGRFMPRAGIYP